jgi:tRNA U38,U39,U40 pseudouridine synthase TruA
MRGVAQDKLRYNGKCSYGWGQQSQKGQRTVKEKLLQIIFKDVFLEYGIFL